MRSEVSKECQSILDFFVELTVGYVVSRLLVDLDIFCSTKPMMALIMQRKVG